MKKKTVLIFAAALAVAGCNETMGPKRASASDPCPGSGNQEWVDGSKLGHKSTRNSGCNTTQRTKEIFRAAGYN